MEKKIEKMMIGKLRDWYEGLCHASDEAGNGAKWYPRYHEETKRVILSVETER